jgi:phage gpG-like protein
MADEKLTYSLEIKKEDLKNLINRLSAATRSEVITRSLWQGATEMANWSKKYRFAGKGIASSKVVQRDILTSRTGYLQSSIIATVAQRVNSKEYEGRYGTNVIYGRIHEFGGLAGRNHSAFIPARPFLRPAIENEDNRRLIIDIFTENINEALKEK